MTRLLAALLIGLALTACAGTPQTAPRYRDDRPQSAEATQNQAPVREDFDPARFREDLLLIEPVFARPPAALPESTRPAEPAPASLDSTPVAVADMASAETAATTTVDTVYRVQVIALSRIDRARAIAAELARRFDVDTDVTSQGSLHTVRAGRFPEPAEASRLKSGIAVLSQGYAGAYVITETDTLTAEPPGPGARTAATDSLPEPPADGVEAWIEADSSGAATVGEAPSEPATEDIPLVRTQGWRVLIGQFFDLASAQDYRARVMNRLSRDDVDVKFEAPWYKVLAGSFRSGTEAQQFVERCRALGYRTATRVPGAVYVPAETSR